MSEEVEKPETVEEDNSSAFGNVVDFAGLVSALTESAEDVNLDQLQVLTGTVNEEKPESAIVALEGQNAEEVQSLEPPQAEAEGAEGEKPAEGEPDEKGKLPPAVQARIDEITREKYEARDQAEKLKAENAELKA